MSGKFQQAWSQFTTAIEQNPRCQAAFEGRAIVNLQMSNLFAALQDVNASLKIKNSAELHTNRGVISLVSLFHITICGWFMCTIGIYMYLRYGISVMCTKQMRSSFVCRKSKQVQVF